MAVTGANGSGKSTLLRILSGQADTHAGTIALDGRDFNPALRRETCHWIGAAIPLKSTLTVHDNLSFWMAMQGAQPNDDSIMRALHRFEIAHLSNHRAAILSTGQKRRVILTRLFLCPRALWLLDEPDLDLDDRGREDLIHAINEHCGDLGAVIIATRTPDLWRPTFTLDLGEKGSGSGFYRMPPSDTPQPIAISRIGLGSSLLAVINRDVRMTRHGPLGCLFPMALFVAISLLFSSLAQIDLALILSALLTTLLRSGSIFADDMKDGTIETITTTITPLKTYIAAHMMAYWILNGLPLVIVSPLATHFLGGSDYGHAMAIVAGATLLLTMMKGLTR